jgi:hypothetical protein
MVRNFVSRRGANKHMKSFTLLKAETFVESGKTRAIRNGT